jgi:lipopolysaccharide export system protein LptA
MRLTIERMRTFVLVAAALLVAALVIFLTVGRWKNPFNRRDLPQRLGIEIQSDSGGVTYTQAHGGHTLFKIHAAKVVQLKRGNALLHDVMIELYGADGSRVDRIEGAEFEYDQKAGTAMATGLVEMTLMRPGVAPAIAPKATAGRMVNEKRKGAPIASLAETAARGEIHVKTSGLTFDQKSGIATTREKVNFSMVQGAGSSMGATFDSDQGLLLLDRAVEMTTERGTERIQIHAQHAQFERESQLCQLRAATADYQGGQATAGAAKILFREDGSAERLDATNGFTLSTPTGAHLTAPTGHMDFNEQNQPRQGRLAGGVTMDSTSESAGQWRQLHGTAPTAELEFAGQGQLRHAHLEAGVAMESEEQSWQAGQPLRVSRHWRSPVADVEFRNASHGQIEPKLVHGTGGVVLTSESRLGGGVVAPSLLSADDLTGEFAPGSVLTSMNGVGHARIEETTAAGVRQTTSGDRLEAHFAASAPAKTKYVQASEAQLQSAFVEGHVVLTQTPAAKPGAPAPSTLRATAGRADYQGQGEWLHLTVNPRVDDGALQMTATKMDLSRASGDAFAHGNVKASWMNTNSREPGSSEGSVALGGQGPAHVVAAEAQLQQATGEAIFTGHARLWQQADSVAAPMIVLDRTRQALTARTASRAEPVLAVLVSAGGAKPGLNAGQGNQPTVIRVRGGELRYSDVERRATMRAGVLGNVVAETGTATSTSDEVEVVLLPAGKTGGQTTPGQAQVDHLTARGHVVLTSEGRRGTGEQLVYTGATGEYVLTGTASTLPKMTDPVRGTVTGEALIFRGRDDSVTVESSGGRKTTTETTAPR